MPETHDDVDHFLSVGRVAVLQTEPQRKDGPRFPTTFVGWRKGRAVYIEHPRTQDGRPVAFRDGQHCVVRFIHEGQACAFASEILDWSTGQSESQVRLRWPAQMERLVLRRFDRVPFIRGCVTKFSDGSTLPGQMTDLSIAGCGLLLHEATTAKGDVISLTFELPDASNIADLRAIVRMIRPAPDGIFLGCEFEPGQDRARNEISLFVTAELARGRHSGAAPQVDAPSVLLLDPDAAFCDKVIRLLERQRLHAVSTQGLVDAMHKLRAIPLHAVAVRENLAELPGSEICRIVHLTRGLERVPLLLYGGDTDPGASRCGAQRWLPDSPSLVPDLALELKRILQTAPACAANA